MAGLRKPASCASDGADQSAVWKVASGAVSSATTPQCWVAATSSSTSSVGGGKVRRVPARRRDRTEAGTNAQRSGMPCRTLQARWKASDGNYGLCRSAAYRTRARIWASIQRSRALCMREAEPVCHPSDAAQRRHWRRWTSPSPCGWGAPQFRQRSTSAAPCTGQVCSKWIDQASGSLNSCSLCSA